MQRRHAIARLDYCGAILLERAPAYGPDPVIIINEEDVRTTHSTHLQE
ncbi:MAG TPA: hypothetical protein VGR09_07585 [Gemmatimonadales bacterium]|nr:hypothetical protein [Gemmatimonadales bacterium]